MSPRTDVPNLRIAPAPRKPIPVTTWAATRDGSTGLPSPGASAPTKPKIDTTVNNAEPSATSRCVRMPAGCSWISRSKPMAAPNTAATSTRTAISSWWVTSGASTQSARSADHRLDRRGDPAYPVGGTSSQPSRTARVASSVRDATPKRSKSRADASRRSWRRCRARAPISSLLRPSATRRTTSCSRGVRWAAPAAAAGRAKARPPGGDPPDGVDQLGESARS